MLELAERVAYDPPPAAGLDVASCDARECFAVEPVVLVGERQIEILPPDGVWLFEELAPARRAARCWLAALAHSHAVGGLARIRHGEALIDPASGRPTSQLAPLAPILDVLTSAEPLAVVAPS